MSRAKVDINGHNVFYVKEGGSDGNMKDVKYSIDIMKQELKNRYISPEIKYAFQASIESMERDVALKVESNQYDVHFCPTCKGSTWQIKSESNYCFRCGQKLNWD